MTKRCDNRQTIKTPTRSGSYRHLNGYTPHRVIEIAVPIFVSNPTLHETGTSLSIVLAGLKSRQRRRDSLVKNLAVTMMTSHHGQDQHIHYHRY
jgi:hypothetical protein